MKLKPVNESNPVVGFQPLAVITKGDVDLWEVSGEQVVPVVRLGRFCRLSRAILTHFRRLLLRQAQHRSSLLFHYQGLLGTYNLLTILLTVFSAITMTHNPPLSFREVFQIQKILGPARSLFILAKIFKRKKWNL